jgi:hypothetical protein
MAQHFPLSEAPDKNNPLETRQQRFFGFKKERGFCIWRFFNAGQ